MRFLLTAFGFLSLLCTTPAKNIDILVGYRGLVYNPSVVKNGTANDTLTFHFFPGQYDVTEGVFSTPCKPKDGGFFSGVVNGNGSNGTVASFQITLTDDSPVWYYSSQTDDCQKEMVGVTNEPGASGGGTLAQFAGNARSANDSVTPLRPVGGIVCYNASCTTLPSPSSTAKPTTTTTRAATSTRSHTAAATTTASSAANRPNVLFSGSSAPVIVLGLMVVVSVC